MRPAKVVLRRFEAADLGPVLDLYANVFGRPAAVDFQARWRWAQEDNPYPECTPKWVLSADGRTVGFLAAIPQPYWTAGREVLAHTPCDYMVHPEFRFHGLKLMQACFRACRHIVSFDDMEATVQVSRWLGAVPVAPLARYVKVLDIRALGATRRWARLPAPLAWPAGRVLRAADAVRNRGGRMGVAVVPAAEFDGRFDAFARRLAEHFPVMVARDARFLDWRYGPGSPHAGRQVSIALDDEGEMEGYVIFHHSDAPGRTGRILDLQHAPTGHPDTAAALLAHAIRGLRNAGAWSVSYHRLEAPSSLGESTLRRHGFVRRGSHQLLVRFGEEALMHTAAEAGNWSLAYGDSEASHAAA